MPTNAPVEERIGCWNMVEKQYEEIECVALKVTKCMEKRDARHGYQTT
jgi:hypothetical protein